MIEKKQILSEWFVGILRPGILVITETLIWKDYVESVNLGMDFTVVKHCFSNSLSYDVTVKLVIFEEKSILQNMNFMMKLEFFIWFLQFLA